nr:hypothetical protein [Tanacetum cinerariifolium]
GGAAGSLAEKDGEAPEKLYCTLLSTQMEEFNPNRSIHSIRAPSTGPPVKKLTVHDRRTSCGGGRHGGVAVWIWLLWWREGNEERVVVVTDVVPELWSSAEVEVEVTVVGMAVVVCRVEDGDDGGAGGVVKVTRDVGEVVVGCREVDMQNQGDVNDALGYKKKAVVVTSDPLALVYEKTKDKKADEKKRDMRKVKCYNYKKERQFAKDCKKAKGLSDSDESSSSAEETIAKKFHDAIESASENFIENNIDSQKDYDKSEVDHNDSEEKEHLVDKLIQKFNHKIAKCQKRIEKANQQSKDLENQNKDLQDKYDVLINQVNTFEEQNKSLMNK